MKNRLIDLTQTIDNKDLVFPGDTPVVLQQVKTLEKDSYNYFVLRAGLHAGTHIDTPMHLTQNNHTIDDYPLETFIGNGVVLNAYESSIVGYKNEYERLITENDIVLICTGYSKYYNTPKYYESYPILSEELVAFLISKKVKIIGIDTPSPDYFPFLVHKQLFRNNILLIENLTNLHSLLDVTNFEVICFPLKIKADSSLVRVVAMIK